MTERGHRGSVQRDDGQRNGASGRASAVRAHESRPGRLVFTEDGNTDGWIATDVAVVPRR